MNSEPLDEMLYERSLLIYGLIGYEKRFNKTRETALNLPVGIYIPGGGNSFTAAEWLRFLDDTIAEEIQDIDISDIKKILEQH